MEGNVIKTSYEPYFAILTDGTAVIRDAGTPTDDVMEAISGPLYLLRNGEIRVTADGSMNPRNSVGIRTAAWCSSWRRVVWRPALSAWIAMKWRPS